MAKAEFTLISGPTAANLIALFEQIKGRKATPEERKAVEREMGRHDQARAGGSGGPGEVVPLRVVDSGPGAKLTR